MLRKISLLTLFAAGISTASLAQDINQMLQVVLKRIRIIMLMMARQMPRFLMVTLVPITI